MSRAVGEAARQPLDYSLFFAVVVLATFGLLMQFSASISISEYKTGDPFFYFKHQTVYLFGVLLLAALIYYKIPLKYIEHLALMLLMFGIGLLVLVFVPGIGSKINGSYRWLDLGVFNVQPSELIKLCWMVYLAHFFASIHQKDDVERGFLRYAAPLLFLSIILTLLLLEPDLGSSIVIVSIAAGLLFVSGFPLKKFMLICAGMVGLSFLAVWLEPYRMRRLTSFSDPWSDPFDSGFQLSQALIAFGRGEVSGAGLGSSIQKYAYLPEAHTDFIFAVVGEELGLMGVCFVVALFLFITLKIITLGKKILDAGKTPFTGYLVIAIGFWLGLQSSINMGVNLGMLPTKGITLPLLSYGGSSLLVTCIAFSIVFKANYEMNRNVAHSAAVKGSGKRRSGGACTVS